MDERTSSSSAVFQELIPASSATLGRYKRAPGRDEGWVDSVLKKIDHEHPSLYGRLKRRLGFALRLAELAELDSRERAVVTLGLFFHEMVDEQARGDELRPSRPWIEYLVKNEYWLAPSFEITEALVVPDDMPQDDRAIIVALVTVAFDIETMERHGRPLIVMQEIFSNARSPAAESVIPVLWTEEGQELCDHHFRQQPYRVDTQEVRRAFESLRRVTPRPAMELPAAPMRFSRPEEAGQPRRRSEPPKAKASRRQRRDTRAAENGEFERRRRALRAGPGWGAILGASEQPEADNGKLRHYFEDDPEEEEEQPEPNDEQELWLPSGQAASGRPAARDQVQALKEEALMAMQNMTSASEGVDSADISGRIDDLREQLETIQRATAEAQHLLAALSPKIEEFATWVNDLEAIVGRWHARDEDAA